MKFNGLIVFVAFSLLLGTTACNNDAGSDAVKPYFDLENLPNDLQGMVELDLGEHGIPLVMLVPDTTKGFPEVTVHPYGETEIKVGRAFWIKIAEGGDMEMKRVDIEDNLLYKSEYMVSEDSCVMYEYTILDDPSHIEHHFYLVRNIGGIEYEISDIDALELSERATRTMMESSKMIVPRRPDKPAPEA